MTEERQAKKREKILEGALRAFLRDGYAANMDVIAAEGGVAKQTVYTYFKDKETLFAALVDRLMERFVLAGMTAELMELEPPAFFRTMTQIALQRMDDPEYVGMIRMIIAESGRFPELADMYLTKLVRPGIESLAQYIRESPSLNFSDPEAVARIIHGALVNFMISQEILNGKYSMPMGRERLASSLLELVLFAAEQAKRAR
ncbi:TetR/AcrR family transcriptional regulator [Candidatus Obscuribacterales bacterium]|nr:TetR/AcrR family transcriptional regulator [Candidatus Obscuribacterales bacterium]MBX3135829.1 TetR/AcrR family transcriptional regulator [Candidatus Obscuribacterales bacterium]MBX3148521.1 TetR/AcrR family transcriptional regulator [Candidatus Obscuribacterales bacterium]